jgi:signal transduction histidine kinase
MTITALPAASLGLRTGLHIFFTSLVALVVIRAIVTASPSSIVVIPLAAVLLATYGLGGRVLSRGRARLRASGVLWLLALTVEWLLLLSLMPEAAYLVFPLSFILLHLLPDWWGILTVLGATGLSIGALGLHSGFSQGGIVGPLVGAGVAIVISLGYRSQAAQTVERERLMRELVATRGQLAATEHESGVLAERARLAREIHDTVAQGLSSIQMLLHAAERADPERAGSEHIRLARETAAASLADTRRFIRELAPAALVDQGIGPALRRLAETQWEGGALKVEVQVADSLELPMYLQTAFLRIAQGAMANVVQHARAATAIISIKQDDDSVQLRISDNGCGFDRDGSTARREAGTSDSFGLTATRERVDQLGGELVILSSPGAGTVLTVTLATAALAAGQPE